MKTFCCGCGKNVNAELVGGEKIYPHRPDLAEKKFLLCPICHNYVGLIIGEEVTIPDEYIRNKRREIHYILDNLWNNKEKRVQVYTIMSNQLGRPYHTGELRTHKAADDALSAAQRTSMVLLGGKE